MAGHNVVVRVRDDESFEKALRRFKKECEKQGVIGDIKKHLRYDKPSVIKNRKRNIWRRKLRRERLQREKEY